MIPLEWNSTEKAILTIIAGIAQKLNIPTYIVGGYVRDKFLNKQSKDIDFSCVGDSSLLVKSLQKNFPEAKVLYFKNFGTSQILLKDYVLEFVTARKESYTIDSRNPIVHPASFEEDIWRRDFTINTLALSLNAENYLQLIDLTQGYIDLKNKILKPPLNPDITFSDDPLRMMRAIRFASQLNFNIAPKTLQSIVHNHKRIEIVSMDRISDELQKIVASPNPSKGFLLMHKTHILELFLPELCALVGTETIDGKAHKNNFYHTLKVLDNIVHLSSKIELRWVALLHDIGKSITKKFDRNIGWTFHGHEYISAKQVKRIFKRLHLSQGSLKQYVEKIIALHHRPLALTQHNTTDSAIRRLLFDAGDDIEDLMLFCEADITTKNYSTFIEYSNNLKYVKKRLYEVEQKDKIRNWKNPISGEYIMKTFNIQPSKVIGDMKKAIKEAVLDGKIDNNFEAAETYMYELAEKMNITKKTI